MKNYDPLQYALSFKGINVDGFADGEFITCGRREATFSLTVGGQGEVARVHNRNATGQIKFVVQATAAVNDLLSAIAIADEKNGSGVGVAQLTALNGTLAVHATNAFLEKVADAKVSKDLPTCEWVLLCEKLDIFDGGSSS